MTTITIVLLCFILFISFISLILVLMLGSILVQILDVLKLPMKKEDKQWWNNYK